VQEVELEIQTPVAIATTPEPVRPVSSAGSMIVFEAVTKVYEPDVAALSGVTFLIEKGEFVFVVGASGSGKSTLVRLLLKELEPTRGKIIVGGREGLRDGDRVHVVGEDESLGISGTAPRNKRS